MCIYKCILIYIDINLHEYKTISVRTDRGATWSPDNLEDLPQKNEWAKMKGEIIGYIPQVS
jgi:hypothetical protein